MSDTKDEHAQPEGEERTVIEITEAELALYPPLTKIQNWIIAHSGGVEVLYFGSSSRARLAADILSERHPELRVEVVGSNVRLIV